MANRDLVSERFRIALANRLKARFGKVLSGQRFSDLFNLNAHGSGTISRETARLWLRGSAMPDYEHLAVLVQWLGLGPEEFLGHHDPATSVRKDEKQALSAYGRSPVIRDLLMLWDELDIDTRRTILVMAKTLSAQNLLRRSPTRGALDIHVPGSSEFQLPTENCQTAGGTYLE